MKLIISHRSSNSGVDSNVNLTIHGPDNQAYIAVGLDSLIQDLCSFRDALNAMHYAGARPGSLLVVHIENLT